MAALGHSSYHQMMAPGAQHRSSGSVSGVDPNRVRHMLAALDHDRLVDIIAELVTKQPSIYNQLRSMLRSDPSQRRLFVRGLSRDCTNQDLLAAFSVYGRVDEAVVMKEKGSQCCKGFGFVTFADADAADAATQQPEKLISGRLAIVSLAALGSRNKPGSAPAPTLYAAPTPSYTPQLHQQPRSTNPHKRYRDKSPPGPAPPLYEAYTPPPSQHYSPIHHQYQQNYYSHQRGGDPHLYRLQESDRVTPPYSSAQMRY